MRRVLGLFSKLQNLIIGTKVNQVIMRQIVEIKAVFFFWIKIEIKALFPPYKVEIKAVGYSYTREM